MACAGMEARSCNQSLCGVVWCGVVWCGVVWCGVVWCGVVWCGAVWCGVPKALLPEGKGRDVLLIGIAKRAGVCACASTLSGGRFSTAPQPGSPGLGRRPGVVWCGVVWCGVVWCGVVWCAEGAVTKRQKAGMSTHGYR